MTKFTNPGYLPPSGLPKRRGLCLTSHYLSHLLHSLLESLPDKHMDCILFRHGIATEWSDWVGDDKDRPLTKEGFEKTRQGAKGLRQLGIQPTHILCSPFLRTQQTAEILHEELEFSGSRQYCPELFSEAAPRHLFTLLERFPKSSIVLCIGHEPHLGHSAAIMLCGQPLNGLSMKKAGASLIRFHGIPEPGAGFLQWWLTPNQLRSLGTSMT